MPTQTSQLVQNLTDIYNEKLLIKAAIPTTSDDFMQYHTYISNLHPSGTSYISANGLSDVSSYQFAYVTVEGGGSGSVKVDPWYGNTNIVAMIENEETTADFYSSIISDNFSATAVEEGGQPTGEYTNISWDEIAEFEENGEPIDKIVHVVLNGDPHEQYTQAGTILGYGQEYPRIYGNIFPILEDVTLTISENPQTDGYDYLIEGSIYAFNLNDCMGGVLVVNNNDFYSNSGEIAFDVNVQ